MTTYRAAIAYTVKSDNGARREYTATREVARPLTIRAAQRLLDGEWPTDAAKPIVIHVESLRRQ